MKVFLDTNIVIDYLSNREPFGDKARRIFLLVEEQDVELCVAALSFTTIYYVLRKQCRHGELLDLLEKLCFVVSVVSTDNNIIANAIKSEFTDFEDAVQYYTALSAEVDYIVTRNTKDYVVSEIPVFTPDEFLSQIRI